MKMTLRQTTCFTIAVVLGLMIVANQAEAQKTQTTTDSNVNTKNIAETLRSLPECSTFVENAEETGVMKELETKQPLTVLVPSNSAYENMQADQRKEIADSERKQKAVTRFHVLNGNWSLEELQTTSEFETWCDEEGDCTLNFAELTRPSNDVISREITCSNGRIYLINTVLIPECCQRGFLERAGDTIEEGVQKTGHAISEGANAVQEGVQSTGRWISKEAHETGEAVSEGTKHIYQDSRAVISRGLEEASRGFKKASDYVAPVDPKSPTPAPQK